MLNYIADFMCKELMLIIEADGSIHQLEEAMKKDAIRQKELEAAGFTVLRFTNEEILERIHVVREYLEDWIEKKVSGGFLSTPK